MKATEKMRMVLLAVALLSAGGRVYAGCTSVWTQPTLLDELNDGDNIAAHPSLSSDGLTMYFSRYIPGLGHGCVVQAYRDTSDGIFTSERVLTELPATGGNVREPWISDDRLRLYYGEADGGMATIRMASRTEPNAVWTPTTVFSELNESGYGAGAPTLTSDELVIIFHSDRPGSAESGYNLWMATRSEPNGVFGNITPLDEINSSLNDMQPSLLPDGLTLYFDKGYGTPDWDIYKATRPSREDPFSDVEYVQVSSDTYDEYETHVTPDETAIYFMSDRGAGGIHVSLLLDVEAFHVDGAGGDDNNDGITRETAFATIQKGVDSAEEGCEVLVWPGTYDENVSLSGKAITLRSADESAVVSPSTGYAFEFFSAEGPDTVLKNFIIADGQYGIHVDIGCSPTITNLTIANNDFGISAVENAEPNISNCIFYKNAYGHIEGCEAKYSLFSDNLGEDLISYWNLDEGAGDTAYDSVGDNHGTLYDPNWTTGKIGKALEFNGVDDYIDLGTDSSLMPAFPVTFSAWIKRFSTGTSDMIIVLGQGANTVSYWGSWLNVTYYDKLAVQYGDGGGKKPDNRRSKLGTTTIGTGIWYHVAGIIRGAVDMDLYINGQPESGSYDGSGGSVNYHGGGSFIGGSPNARSPFDGLIDEVAVWDRSLDAGEIQQIYNDGLSTHTNLDPLFADPDAGDYHLKSEKGRYWPDHDVWVLDSQTSPCVDGGNPTQYPGAEPMPSGGRINMGAYGGTAWASLSEWPLEGDINQDGIVNLADVGFVVAEWLSALPCIE